MESDTEYNQQYQHEINGKPLLVKVRKETKTRPAKKVKARMTRQEARDAIQKAVDMLEHELEKDNPRSPEMAKYELFMITKSLLQSVLDISEFQGLEFAPKIKKIIKEMKP